MKESLINILNNPWGLKLSVLAFFPLFYQATLLSQKEAEVEGKKGSHHDHNPHGQTCHSTATSLPSSTAPPRDVPPPLLLKCPLSYLLIHCRSWDLIPTVQMRKLRFTGTQSDPTSSWWDLEIQPRAVSWSFFKPLGLSTGHTRHGRQHPNCLQGLLQPLRQAAPGGRGWAPTMTTFL